MNCHYFSKQKVVNSSWEPFIFSPFCFQCVQIWKHIFQLNSDSALRVISTISAMIHVAFFDLYYLEFLFLCPVIRKYGLKKQLHLRPTLRYWTLQCSFMPGAATFRWLSLVWQYPDRGCEEKQKYKTHLSHLPKNLLRVTVFHRQFYTSIFCPTMCQAQSSGTDTSHNFQVSEVSTQTCLCLKCPSVISLLAPFHHTIMTW